MTAEDNECKIPIHLTTWPLVQPTLKNNAWKVFTLQSALIALWKKIILLQSALLSTEALLVSHCGSVFFNFKLLNNSIE